MKTSKRKCRQRRPVRLLTVLGGVSAVVYLLVLLSAQSLHEEGTGRQSLLVLLGLFGVAFGCYLAAIPIAVRAHQNRRVLLVIIGGAVLFRGLLLLSDPIEEIDLYRYLWDGMVVAEGISPYRYSPQQVLSASADVELPNELVQLVALRDGSFTVETILRQIHFGQLPTIYPPVSQAVFAAAAWLTPTGASLWLRLVVMKGFFVAFDLATLLVLVQLLRFAGRSTGWCIVYAWCPLVIKEVANSGHLDSLAVFLTLAATYLAAMALYALGSRKARFWIAMAAPCLLALAVGAKLYPVVLAPWLLLSYAGHLGWKMAGLTFIVFTTATLLLLLPMLPGGGLAPLPESPRPYPQDPDSVNGDLAPLPPPEVDYEPRDPSQSLRAFLSQWEMNDFLFMIVVENLRPAADLPARLTAWFSITPESWRERLSRFVQIQFAVTPRQAPFLAARTVTSLGFVLLATWLAWRGSRADSITDWLESAFLTVAWFWLLLPTLNPWYWLWALPLVVFSQNRAWIVLSGLVFFYYLRFWLVHHFPDPGLLGTPYSGAMFFDYVVTWLEFGPWFVWLAAEWRLRSRPRQFASQSRL